MVFPYETLANFRGSGARAKIFILLTTLEDSDNFKRVRGPTTEGVRAGNPGIMILCETLDNSRGSRAATPNRVAALSQNGYGHRRAGKKLAEAGAP